MRAKEKLSVTITLPNHLAVTSLAPELDHKKSQNPFRHRTTKSSFRSLPRMPPRSKRFLSNADSRNNQFK
jgi:hypothetical protein